MAPKPFLDRRIDFHFLNARGQLDPYIEQVRTAVSKVVEATTVLKKLGPLDIVVQEGSWVIPQTGHSGDAPKPGLVFLTLDPRNEALTINMGRSLERVIAHEFHHASRWDTVGYGETLGEVLVTEGLAGHFVQEVYGDPPEPWESAVSFDELRTHFDVAAQEWASKEYNHMRWFFGEGDLPHWLGYALGHQLVGRYLKANPEFRPSQLVSKPAASFRSVLDRLSEGRS